MTRALLGVVLAAGLAHAGDTTMVGRVQRIMVMDHDHRDMLGAIRIEYWLYPSDPEVAWTALKQANHPSTVPAVRLEGYEDVAARGGERIEVTGTLAGGDTLVVEHVEPKPLSLPQRALAWTGLTEGTPPAIQDLDTGPQRGLVILAGWPDRPLDPSFTVSAVQNAIATITKPNMEANAYGRATYMWDVISLGNVLSGAPHCRFPDGPQEAVNILGAQGFDFRPYQFINFGADPGPGCFGGISFVCVFATIMTPQGRLPIGVNWDSTRYGLTYFASVICHETGHLMCSLHGKANIGTTGLPLFGRFAMTKSEYGDRGTWMGDTTPQCQMRGTMKRTTGLLHDDELRVVSVSGDYDLVPMESAVGVKLLQIRRGNVTGSADLYVETRAPAVGSACEVAARGTPYLAGLGLMVLDGDASDLGGGPILLGVTTPATTGWEALVPGQTFTDPATGTRVTALSRTRVHVDMGTIDTGFPVVRYDTPATTVLRAGDPLAITVSDASPTVLLKVWLQGENRFTAWTTTVPPGSYSVPVNICAVTGSPVTAYVIAVDHVANAVQLPQAYAVDRAGCGAITTTTSTTLRPTTSTTRVPATTTTSRPLPSTTSTTLAGCRPAGVTCMLWGRKMASLCCSKRCGGGRRCK